jgi:hypothetical protein
MSDDGYFHDDEGEDFDADLFWNDDGEIILAVRSFYRPRHADEVRLADHAFRTTLLNTPFHHPYMLKIPLMRIWRVIRTGSIIQMTITMMILLY